MLKNSMLLMTAALVVVSFSIISCETDEDNKIAKAQKCLDEANSEADGAKCAGMVSGINSKQAKRIVCASNFITQGFLMSTFGDIFDSLEEDSGSGNPAMDMAAELAFEKSGTPGVTDTDDSAFAVETDAICRATNSPGLAMLSSYALIATVGKRIENDFGGANSFEEGLENFDQMTPAEQTAVAGATKDMAEEYCADGTGDEEICGPVEDAVESGATDEEIAVCMGWYLAGADPATRPAVCN
jgi:hypothetical protein